MKQLSTIILAICALLSASPPAHATDELDRETRIKNAKRLLAENLPKAVVVRVENERENIAVLHSSNSLAPENLESVLKGEFEPMKASEMIFGELDRDSSSNSWYFYFWNSQPWLPAFYYYGFNFYYRPYYSYYAQPYWYHWYRWY